MFYSVPNYEFAEVNEKGEVRSSLTKYVYAPYVDKDGYLRCKIWDGVKLRGIYVHRAIALVFVDNPENKPVVNHKDSNRSNNSIGNLEWVTPRENSEHGVLAGNFLKSEDAFASVYTNEQIHKVCQLIVEKTKLAEISKQTGVNLSTVGSVKVRRTWEEISKEYVFPEVKSKVLDKDAIEIIRLLSEGFSYKEVVVQMDHPRINRDTVGNIALGKTFKHLKVTFNDHPEGE